VAIRRGPFGLRAGVTSAFESGNSGDAVRIGHLRFSKTRIFRTKLGAFLVSSDFRWTSSMIADRGRPGCLCCGPANSARTPRGHPAPNVFVSSFAFRPKISSRAQVDLLSQRRQLLVVCLFLVEASSAGRRRNRAAELLCPTASRLRSAYLVMPLAACAALIIAASRTALSAIFAPSHPRRFLDEASIARQSTGLTSAAVHLAHLLEPLHMRLGLVEMGPKSLLERLSVGLFGPIFGSAFTSCFCGI